jgi:hypothetical protein
VTVRRRVQKSWENTVKKKNRSEEKSWGKKTAEIKEKNGRKKAGRKNCEKKTHSIH